MGRSRNRKMSRTDRMFYKLDREKQWEKQGKKCHYCERKLARGELTFDHKIPISVTGYHGLTNCVVACWDCNQEKGNKTNWTYTGPKEELTELGQIAHDLIEAWKVEMDGRMKRFEYSLTTDTKGGYHKWVRYWTKRGKWD